MIAVMIHPRTPRVRAAPLSKLTPQLQHLPERADDHGRTAARLAAGLPWKVMHSDFRDPRAELPRARQHLHVDERAGAAKLRHQAIEHLAAVNLERAVHVADGNAEQEPARLVVEKRIEAP